MNSKNFAFSILIAFASSILPSKALALNCSSPAGAPGSINENSGYKICNGTNGSWEDINLTTQGSTCTDKQIDYDASLQKHKVCVGGAYKTTNCVTTTVSTGYCSTVSQLKFTPSDSAANDYFGRSITTNGEWMAVGSQKGAGAVYMYSKVGSTWSFQQKITPGDGVAGDYFGWSVSVSGNTLVIGAKAATVTLTSQGAVYIYTYNGSTWVQQQKIISPSANFFQGFGSSVAVYNDTLVAGTDLSDAYVFNRSGGVWSSTTTLSGTASSSVAIYDKVIAVGEYNSGSTGTCKIYYLTAGTWTLESTVSASDASINDFFGKSVAVYGNGVVIGASGKNAAYYFTRSGSTWSEQKKLTASDAGAINFGVSVSIYNNYIMVGAPDYNSGKGAAYIFYGSGSTWGQLARQVGSDSLANDEFGLAVSFYGSTAVAAATQATINSNSFAGAVYIIPLFGLRQTLTSGTSGDLYGTGQAAAISGDYLIIGASSDDSAGANAGAAYIYLRDASGVWALQQKITGVTGDGLGISADIDGATAVIGGSAVGKAWVYTRSGTTWTLKATYTGAVASKTGNSVSISGDTIAIGEPYAASGGTERGQVIISRFNGTTLTTEATLTRTGGGVNYSHFGMSVAIEGDVLAVGAPSDSTVNGIAGKAFVFNRSVTTWDAGTNLPNSTAAVAKDNYGYKVAISAASGTQTIAVSQVPQTAISTTKVDVFTGSGTSWSLQQTIIGSDISGVTATFGNSIALYGNYLAVGAMGSNSYKGAMYYYTRAGSTWTEGGKFSSTSSSSESFGSSVTVENGYAAATNSGGSGINGTFYYYSTTGDPVESCSNVNYPATNNGSASTTTPRTFTVSLSAGQAILVCVASYLNLPASNAATFDGVAMTMDAQTGTASTMTSTIYSYYTASALASKTLSVTSGSNNSYVYYTIVNGLDSTMKDKSAAANGGAVASTSPSSGSTATTTQDQEFVFGCMAQQAKVADPGTITAPLTQMNYQFTGSGGSPGPNVAGTTAYYLTSAPGTFAFAKTGSHNAIWASAVATYKSNSSNSPAVTTCASYGSCAIAGALDYSSGNGVRWCDGSVWRQIKVGP